MFSSSNIFVCFVLHIIFILQMKQVMQDLTQQAPTEGDTHNAQNAQTLLRQEIISLSEDLQRSRLQVEELRSQLRQSEGLVNEKHHVGLV
jgi:uncharacterized protein YlxW (UPF0749 family)